MDGDIAVYFVYRLRPGASGRELFLGGPVSDKIESLKYETCLVRAYPDSLSFERRRRA